MTQFSPEAEQALREHNAALKAFARSGTELELAVVGQHVVETFDRLVDLTLGDKPAMAATLKRKRAHAVQRRVGGFGLRSVRAA